MLMSDVHRRQHTIKNCVSASGVGLFTGLPAAITLMPGAPSSGIVFRRCDLALAPVLPAAIHLAIETPRHTTVQQGETCIETTEHILSALAGMGIDNAILDITGPEVPLFDGSAQRFVEMIAEAGLDVQSELRRVFIVKEDIVVRDGDASITLSPADHDSLDLTYGFDGGPGCAIAPHDYRTKLTSELYERDIAPARTFSTLADAQAAQAQGLFAHVSPADVLVIDHDGPIDNALRFKDEPARHKMLDLIGDLSLAGVPVIGRVRAVRSGHALNRALARRIAGLALAQ